MEHQGHEKIKGMEHKGHGIKNAWNNIGREDRAVLMVFRSGFEQPPAPPLANIAIMATSHPSLCAKVEALPLLASRKDA
jgi:hypothetical protein